MPESSDPLGDALGCSVPGKLHDSLSPPRFGEPCDPLSSSSSGKLLDPLSSSSPGKRGDPLSSSSSAVDLLRGGGPSLDVQACKRPLLAELWHAWSFSESP